MLSSTIRINEIEIDRLLKMFPEPGDEVVVEKLRRKFQDVKSGFKRHTSKRTSGQNLSS